MAKKPAEGITWTSLWKDLRIEMEWKVGNMEKTSTLPSSEPKRTYLKLLRLNHNESKEPTTLTIIVKMTT